ncbi:protein disulfide-isomerase, putative [Plasmodium ovale curtisi]|uniref:Protein disulfide-isomerase, putative n=1 Tax=Plasmodium ovale curtisi TaxID=864141 RepID=A0A1A8W0G1_PLAOA|nr:protein disulfide-isomerase, putative [Plasmodium ovale curtisi]SBS96703.1 protein disulfide-isomerase, putative [Plasmodium ovale curtisi]
MTYIKFLFLLYFLIKVYSTVDNDEKKGETLSIDMNDFENILKDEEKFTLVVVYTHWCHRSNLLIENLGKISNLLKYDSNVQIAKINAAMNSEIIDRLNVYSYPSLFMIKKDEIHKYNGVNSTKGIISWIYEHLDEIVYEINSKEKLNTFLGLDEYNNSILFFISRKEKDVKVIKELTEICTLTESTFCFYLKEQSIVNYFENTILSEKYHFNVKELENKDIYGILFKNDDFDQYFYLIDEHLNMLYDPDLDREIKIDQLTKWIQKKVEPLVIKFSEYYFSLLFSSDTVTLFILYNDINELNKTDIIKCAKKYKNINFSLSGNNEIYEKRLLSELLIDNLKNPVMRITEFKNHINIPYKYKPQNDDMEINEKNIDDFIRGYTAEKKYFYRKSERPLPDEFNNGYVKIIVADTYDEYIYNSEKNVVVLYYAPWCGHCYKFEPVYREIGRRLKLYASKFTDYDNNIVISKIDAVNNEIYNIPIEGYPTIYLYTKANKEAPIKYVGPRTVQSVTSTNIDMEQFLNLNLDDEQLFENYEEL